MPEISFQFRAATQGEIGFTANKLLEHSRNATGLNVDYQPFGLLAYKNETLIASAIGKIFLSWLHLDLVWVEENYRKQGLGKKLLLEAVHKAKALGLQGIEVWTQSWQAPDFYKKIGFEEFAVMDDFIPGRKRHVFRHYIVSKPPAAIVAAPTSLPEIVREQIQSYFKRHGSALPSAGIYDRLMPLFEKPLIEVTLEATGGNQLKTAKLLGINRNTLHKKIKQLRIVVSKNNAETVG